MLLRCLLAVFLFGVARGFVTHDVCSQWVNDISLKVISSMSEKTTLIGHKGRDVHPLIKKLIKNATSIRESIIDSFRCDERVYGYYADQDNDCQIFHICVPMQQLYPEMYCAEDIFHFSFICPQHTIFNQEAMVCDWVESAFPCSAAHELYSRNNLMFVVPAEETYKESASPATTTSAPKSRCCSNRQRLDRSSTSSRITTTSIETIPPVVTSPIPSTVTKLPSTTDDSLSSLNRGIRQTIRLKGNNRLLNSDAAIPRSNRRSQNMAISDNGQAAASNIKEVTTKMPYREEEVTMPIDITTQSIRENKETTKISMKEKENENMRQSIQVEEITTSWKEDQETTRNTVEVTSILPDEIENTNPSMIHVKDADIFVNDEVETTTYIMMEEITVPVKWNEQTSGMNTVHGEGKTRPTANEEKNEVQDFTIIGSTTTSPITTTTILPEAELPNNEVEDSTVLGIINKHNNQPIITTTTTTTTTPETEVTISEVEDSTVLGFMNKHSNQPITTTISPETVEIPISLVKDSTISGLINKHSNQPTTTTTISPETEIPITEVTAIKIIGHISKYTSTETPLPEPVNKADSKSLSNPSYPSFLPTQYHMSPELSQKRPPQNWHYFSSDSIVVYDSNDGYFYSFRGK